MCYILETYISNPLINYLHNNDIKYIFVYTHKQYINTHKNILNYPPNNFSKLTN